MKKFLFFITLVSITNCQAQFSLSKYITPSDTLNKKREWAVHGTCAGTFSVAMIGLNYAWYANYPRSKFHFFDDNGDAKSQKDKGKPQRPSKKRQSQNENAKEREVLKNLSNTPKKKAQTVQRELPSALEPHD